MIIAQYTDKGYPDQYCDTPARYFDQLKKIYQLDLSVIKVPADIGQGYSSPYIQSHLPSTYLPSLGKIYLLLVWLFIPIALSFLVSVLLVPIYWTRYTLGGSLPFYLLVAKGLRNVPYPIITDIMIQRR